MQLRSRECSTLTRFVSWEELQYSTVQQYSRMSHHAHALHSLHHHDFAVTAILLVNTGVTQSGLVVSGASHLQFLFANRTTVECHLHINQPVTEMLHGTPLGPTRVSGILMSVVRIATDGLLTPTIVYWL
jgi:hypothetical protein